MIKIPHSFPYLTDTDKINIDKAYDDYFVGFDEKLDIEIKNKLSKFFVYPYVHILPSASLALLLILKACKLEEGDEVILSAINCWSVYNIIRLEKLKPIICDVRLLVDFRVSIEDIRNRITNKTKIIILTHMFGAIIDYDDIKLLKKDYPDIYIIEDFSTSFLPFENMKYGAFSDFAIGSFGSTKPLTGGIGGMLLSKYGFFSQDYDAYNKNQISFNMKISRMDQLLLNNQINKYSEYQSIRKIIIEFYKKYLNIYQPNGSTMFRAITFDDPKKLVNILHKYEIMLDIRNSVQPNFAKELKLEKLQYSFNFSNYYSLPLNVKLYETLKDKGLL